ncbi:hypothetical protein NDU88_006697 [Pleurodeles waltl]|uniref:Uncharacterized protein n=1 Tax=Pleurodeles waltl TaxID=8319 RepID=A0AAV7VQD7_PLEWA|nr:hypothetical protein NDU88_006697 [Pleurodeles waltl]
MGRFLVHQQQRPWMGPLPLAHRGSGFSSLTPPQRSSVAGRFQTARSAILLQPRDPSQQLQPLIRSNKAHSDAGGQQERLQSLLGAR